MSLREAYDYALLHDYFGPYGDDIREHPQYYNEGDLGDRWSLAGAIPGFVPIPEPISLVFFGTGLVAVLGYVARRKLQRS